MTSLERVLKSRDITLPTKIHLNKAVVFPVVMYGCESWTIKKDECQTIDAFELWCWRRLLKVPWTARRSNQVHPKGNQPWIFIGRTDAKAETPILWPLDAKSWLIRKDADAGKDWRQEEKGTTEDETVGWHHRLNGHEFEQTPGGSEGQGNLVCGSPWGCRVGHDWATERRQIPVVGGWPLLTPPLPPVMPSPPWVWCRPRTSVLKERMRQKRWRPCRLACLLVPHLLSPSGSESGQLLPSRGTHLEGTDRGSWK